MDKLIQIEPTPLARIPNHKGSIFHALKKSEQDFVSFGEAYFSQINYQEVKGWKKHTRMHLNLIVPAGTIRFVIYCGKEKQFREFVIGENNYGRLHIPPGFWMAFQGVGEGLNILLNIASIEHDPEEVIKKEIDKINYKWS